MSLDLTRACGALALLTLVGCARGAAGLEQDAAVRRVGDMSQDPSTAGDTARDASDNFTKPDASHGEHGGGDVSAPSADAGGGATPGSGTGEPVLDASVTPVDGGASVTPVDGGASATPVDGGASATPVDGGAGGPTQPAPDAEVTPAPVDDGCTWAAYAQHAYLFCKTGHNTTWAGARSFCQARGMDLVRIESSGEDSFVSANILADAWIGLSDLDGEGNWRWINPGGTTQGPLIYIGTWMAGSAQNGAYTHWNGVDPNDYNGSEDCARILSGAWWDTSCNESREFVCE